MRTGLQVNFLHRRVWHTVVILEEGNLPHPKCPRYDMLVPWVALNGCHPNTAQYEKGAERKRHRLTEEEMRGSTRWDFQAYGHPLTSVSLFKYLFQVLIALYYDWLTVVGNFS